MAKDDIEKLEAPDTGASSSSKTKKRKAKGSNRISKWFREMRSELKKVTWPTGKQIVNNTTVALTVMTLAAIAVWALDFASSQIFQAIINIPDMVSRWSMISG